MSKLLCLLFICAICPTAAANISEYDSLRTEQREGLDFIVHKVEPKETLFSISRRYNVKVKSILQYNESVENGLKMYQELFIPYNLKLIEIRDSINRPNSIHIVQAKETLYFISKKYEISIDELKAFNNLVDFNIGLGDTLIISSLNSASNNDLVNEEIDSTSTEDVKFHIVEPTETLYSISIKFKQDIQDIKNWNNLTSNNLSVGQRIKFGIPASDSIKSVLKSKVIVKPIDTLYVSTDNSRFKKKTETNGNVGKTLEEGFATKIDQTENTRKYLALHRYAPIGTVIEVKNQMTNLSIFARVVGKLPETGLNQNVLIRLSHAAFSKLGALDSKIPIQIGFIIE